MAIIPFTVYAEVTALMLGSVYIGFSVDEPLPEKFSNQLGKVMGILDIYGVGINVTYGPTTRLVSAGTGIHYVVLGIQFGEILPNISSAKLRLTGAGTSAEYSFGPLQPVKYLYIAFEIKSNGAIVPIASGVIEPGAAPISTPGGGSALGADVSTAMSEAMHGIIEMMLPLMMLSMMVNMMTGMVMSLTQAFTVR